MKPETQGKLMVAMVISILAFGFGTGAAMVTGLYQNTNSTPLNITKQPDFPSIPTTKNNNVNNSPSTSPNSQDNGQSQQNNNNPSSNNTTT